MAWYNKNKLRIQELEKINNEIENENFRLKEEILHLKEENSNINNKCQYLEKDVETLSEWITDDGLYNFDLKLKNAQLRFLNVLIEIKAKKELAETKASIKEQVKKSNSKLKKKQKILQEIKSQIIEFDDQVLYQDFGLYTPMYELMYSSEYKEKILECRNKQKLMVKEKHATIGGENWCVNNSRRRGKQMINRNIKLLIRCFNNECDTLISKVKFNNYYSIQERIERTFTLLNELTSTLFVEINEEYLNLKLEELSLCYEYENKKNEEKEQRRIQREKEREQAKLLKEIEEARKKIQKEQTHYTTQLKFLNDQIEIESNSERLEFLLQKKNDVEKNLIDLDIALKDVDYREANQKAGYVYVISNIGAFGNDVYKIGMTRRLNPQDRIDELGGASVPFKFDIHAMIFSDDAPALEAALHRAFENRKVNMANGRKEFFNVTLDEIKKVINANYDKTVDFIDIPPAQQYRESLKLKEKITD